MRSTWSRWLLITFIIWRSLGAAPAGAQSEYDVRGTWTTSTAFDGDKPFQKTLVITDQDADGAIRGSWDQHGEGASAVMVGRITGSRMVLTTTKANASYRYTGTVRVKNSSLVWSGRWVGPVSTWTGPVSARLVKGVASAAGGDRRSATLVVCDRDMTAPTDDAVLVCTAQVTDGSAQPGSSAPTGTVTWSTKTGTLTPETCDLAGSGGSTAWCSVTLRAPAGTVPIGVVPPVGAAYAGDSVFGPSDAAPQLFGGTGGYAESDSYGPGCNPASVPQPTTGCGDPVNPATGNLVIDAVDLAIGGRGPGLTVERTYNALAAAAGEVGRFGAGWSDAYGARVAIGPKKAVTVHLGTGATVPFTVKGKRFVAPPWVTATLARGKDKGYRFTLRDRTVLDFDRDGRLRTVSDRTGEPVTLAYDADGALASVTDAAGRTIRFTTEDRRVVAATDPTGREVRYAYDPGGDLVAVTDVLGATTTYTYDERHRLLTVTDATGSRVTNAYDDAGRVVRQSDPLGASLAFAYAGVYPDLVTVVTDGNGVRSSFEHRGGLLVAETRAIDGDAPSRTSHIYDGDRYLVATIDPVGGLWRYARDADGDIVAWTDPLGRTTSATYSPIGDLLSVTAPGGSVTRIDRDDRGLITRVVRAAGTSEEAATIVGRDDADHPGDVTSITEPGGAVTTYAYDAHGEPISRTDALGHTTIAARDALGWLTSVTDPAGATTAITRDAAGMPLTVVDRLGGSTSLQRDPLGRPVTTTDALGQVTSIGRDGTGRVTAVTLSDGTTTGTEYDASGAVTGLVGNDGTTWTVERDGHGRIDGWVDPLGARWSATYDAGGRVLTTTDPTGAVTRYQWDAAQLTGIDHADGTPDVSFTYDPDGRRATMADGTGTTRITRDRLGRITSVTDGAGATVVTTYDAAGDLASITYPDGGTVEREHDANGRLVAVRDWLGNTSTFTWDAAGRLMRIVAGDGSVTERTYDPRGGLIGITVAAAGATQPLLVFGYERDALGRVVSVSESGIDAAADAPTLVTRDAQGRLTGFGDATFTSDASGALATLRGGTLTSDAAGGLLSAHGSAGTTSFTNDAAGRRTGSSSSADGGAMAFAWDGAGNLVAAGNATFTFDGDGRRMSADWGDGTSSTFTWLTAADTPQLLGDGESWYVRGPDGMPLEEIRADGSVRWLHVDQAGSVRAVTDAAGTLTGTASWDAYGLPVGAIGDASRLGFQGHHTDRGTGLLSLGARPYDPATGRFLAIDPLVLRTRQPYTFANGDPLTFGDTSGAEATLLGSAGGLVPASVMLDSLGLPSAAMTCAAGSVPSTLLTDLQDAYGAPSGHGPVRQALERAGVRFDADPEPLFGALLHMSIQLSLDGTGLGSEVAPMLQQGVNDILSGQLSGGPFLGH